jgi:hypothetical protein
MTMEDHLFLHARNISFRPNVSLNTKAGMVCFCIWFFTMTAGASGQSLFTRFQPSPFRHVHALKLIIAYRLPPLRDTRKDHLARVDAIFRCALRLTDGNLRDALITCALATIPYKSFKATIPMTGLAVPVPISFESDSLFSARMRGLPGLLFHGHQEVLDRDKLPHFFGSAWLHLTLRFAPLIELLGLGVETFEKIFFLEGAYDPRDMNANTRGIRFAESILHDSSVRPSLFFRLQSPYLAKP